MEKKKFLLSSFPRLRDISLPTHSRPLDTERRERERETTLYSDSKHIMDGKKLIDFHKSHVHTLENMREKYISLNSL